MRVVPRSPSPSRRKTSRCRHIRLPVSMGWRQWIPWGSGAAKSAQVGAIAIYDPGATSKASRLAASVISAAGFLIGVMPANSYHVFLGPDGGIIWDPVMDDQTSSPTC
jgi:hypothetical protein